MQVEAAHSQHFIIEETLNSSCVHTVAMRTFFFVFMVEQALLFAVLGQGSKVEPLNHLFAHTTENYTEEQLSQIENQVAPKGDGNAKDVVQPAGAGKVQPTISSQIVGGEAASLGQFPWQANIIINDAYICGGSLITSNFVLTAAHCTSPGSTFQVTLGTIKMSNANPPSPAVRLITSVKFTHESYNPNNLNNDIGLLKLPSSVSLSTYINVIKLPPATDGEVTYAGSTATVSGFGKTSDSSSASPSMQFVNLTVISNLDCAKFYGTDIITSSTLCTQVPKKSTCQGDSGGPLVIPDGPNSYKQIGVVSFGSASGCLAGPSGFIRVTSYLTWISNKIGQEGATPETTTTTTEAATTTTTSPITSPNCAAADFRNTMSSCCLSPARSTVVLAAREKTCGADSQMLVALNNYVLNNIQDMEANNTINLKSQSTQNLIAKDACFAYCFLRAKNVVNRSGALSLPSLVTFLMRNQNVAQWRTATRAAAQTCYQEFYGSTKLLVQSGTNAPCDARSFFVVQCVQAKLTQSCQKKSSTSQCNSQFKALDTCFSSI
ncbi:Hypothetical predicted protein [Cloeon dipterum]|uniref:Peptidase S1 domain-containing protein n=1 Tax=Cloeon dipterum TaxID=197152 RepID=A0A8S1DF20_9INSE|nr:Hypothetical predicted protein [Cloeon dipterum]